MPYEFNEINHTADWALEVKAPDLNGLFVQAALGMNWLMGVTLEPGKRNDHILKMTAVDHETLLVAFLNEILFNMETESIAFDEFDIRLDGLDLQARLHGARMIDLKKPIKAATYHNLDIRKTMDGFETTIVFDV